MNFMDNDKWPKEEIQMIDKQWKRLSVWYTKIDNKIKRKEKLLRKISEDKLDYVVDLLSAYFKWYPYSW